MARERRPPAHPRYPEHFPDVVAALDDPDIGGDPARFLCTGNSPLTRARIRGIRDEATIRAWIAVTNALRQRGRLDDPDYWNVIGQLRERKAELEARPDEQVHLPVQLEVIRAKRDQDRDRPTSATAKIASLRTDGGDDERECFRCGLWTDPEDVDDFDLPDGETVELCPTCRERWADRVFILGGESA